MIHIMNGVVLIFMLSSVCCASYTYKTKYIDVPIDHFSFVSNATFKLKYLINDTDYISGSPIFFYTGNEGEIETFAQNTGFINEIAPQFHALIVFAEHRYYGESMPFGNKTFTDNKYLGFLNTNQALADFVYLINDLQKQYKRDQTYKLPVIAFGGSYGGMLSAWLRMKYPASVLGAIAASAPIWQFQGLTPCENFNRIVTDVFEAVGDKNCVETITKSWPILRSELKSDTGKALVQKTWNLCEPVKDEKDVNNLVDWVSEILTNIVMVNYPYSTSFLAPLPPSPVREFCNKLNAVKQKTNLDVLVAIKEGFSIYTNYTGSTKCNNIENTSGNLGENGWNYQACTEMIMPMCSTDKDMFENAPWDIKKYSEECLEKFSVGASDPELPILEYGGKDISSASNIVFSNGLMDPWSSGGVLSNVSSSIYAVVIPDGAHHYDLRSSNPKDTGSVKEARQFHVNTIKQWLNSFYISNYKFHDNEISRKPVVVNT